jgi:hypothetical protein
MGPVGGKGSAGLDDLVGMTMRPAFRGWPWRPFREVTPDIVELRADPSLASQAQPVRDFLRRDGATVSVVVSGPAAEPSPALADVPVIALLSQVADLLNRCDDTLSFPRTRLLRSLAALTVERPARRELSYGLVRALRQYWRDPDSAAAPDGSFLPAVIRSGSSGLTPVFLEVAARLLQPHFSLWFWGVPGLGPECRWLRQQRGRQSLKTFALGLTRGREMPAAEVEFLAVRAFLADLRAAYQPRLWWRRTWRVRRPVLVLDQPGDDLPRLLDRARREAPQAGDKPSPLLVLMVPKADQEQPAVPALVVRVPEQLGPPGQPPFRPRRPWLARMASVAGALGVPALVLVLGLGLVGGSAPRPQAATTSDPACPRGPGSTGANHLDVTPWKSPEGDIECVGYIDASGTSPFVFSNPGQLSESAPQQVQDERIEHDQRAIFAENARVDSHSNGRAVVELVYFAGLTEGANEDYDSAEAEELEGLYAVQKAELDEEDAPLLKVVVANGGSKMQDAVPVAHLLVSLFRTDRQLLGVVGMDRSITPVQDAIQIFSGARIPVVATTLSADGIGQGSPYYFQLSPSNTREAALMLQYIQRVVPLYFAQRRSAYDSGGQLKPTSVTVYEPPPYSEVTDSLGHREKVTDLYTLSLVQDLRKLAPDYPGITEQVRPPVFTNQLAPSQLCGSSTVDIYAGRHDRPLASKNQFDDFTLFLRTIADDCAPSQQPFIIADDGVTRFIADPAARTQLGLGNVVISYVTKGIAIMRTRQDCLAAATAAEVPSYQQEFCQEYASIASQLLALPKVDGQGLDLLWTGERVGLAYDAGMLFIQAVQNFEKDSGAPVRPADVPAEFESSVYHGVTGSVDFTSTSHTGADTPDGMPLTIVRIHLSSPTAVPLCAYPGPDGQLFDLVPSGGLCPDGYL